MSTTTRIVGARAREQLPGSGITILAPGFEGEVTQLTPVSGDGRAIGDSLPVAEAAAGTSAMIASQLVLDLEARPDGAPAELRGRSGAVATPRVVVPRRKGVAYALLQTDEDGFSNWVLPESLEGADAVFTLTPSVRASSNSGARGPVTAAMRRLVRVIVWAAQPGLERGALAVANRFEKQRRPNKLLQVSAEGSYSAPDWQQLSGGPVLLLVHGTFSTPEAAFHGWVGDASFAAVAKQYGGRCLAFAHPSLGTSPDDNVNWLLGNLGAPLPGPVDVVCHSRGGLVARALATDERVRVRRVVQVGTPNRGTPLAAAEQVLSFIDGHTSLLTKLPDSVTTIVLEGLLCVVKLLATGAVGGLPGLNAMEPEGEYLTSLAGRAARGTEWFTVSADYRASAATQVRIAQRAGDAVVDRFFASANDLVVPADGCHEPGAEVTDSLRLSGGEVHHTNYFLHPEVRARLGEWLARAAT
jgi:pimeloyl-ACP methyl ester carboxylesterase